MHAYIYTRDPSKIFFFGTAAAAANGRIAAAGGMAIGPAPM